VSSFGGDIGSRLRALAPLVVIATAMLMALVPVRSEGGRPASVAGHLATLKPGHWIQIDGTVRGGEPALCTEVRVLTGDFLDDDWALKGTVQTVDAGKRELAIGGVRVQVTENTSFDSPTRTFKGFPDLRPGMLLEVEGTYLRNGTFLAAEVDDESDENARKPWSRDRVVIVGKVEQVDSRKRLVSAMGFVFQVTEKTRLRSVIE